MDSNVDINPKKVRQGLAVVTVILLVSAVMVVVADDAIGKSIFFAIAGLTLLRAALLARWLRRNRTSAALA